MNIVISGSQGFIGKHLLQELRRNTNIHLHEIDIMQGYNLCEWESIKHIKKFDLFIHLANKVFVPDSFIKPQEFYSTNFNSTLNALELCRLNNAKMIYISSYVYGKPRYLPIDENHILQSYNPYSNSKIICEKLCKGYFEDFNVPILIIRPFNIFGPGQSKDFLIASLFKQANEGSIEVNDIRPKRDYLYIKDFISFLLAVVEKGFTKYEIYNIGAGESISVEDLIKKIIKLHNGNVQFFNRNKHRDYEIMDIIADISRAKSVFGWSPKYNIETALEDYYLCENLI